MSAGPASEHVINNANRIHLIERQDRFERIEGNVWESSFWALRPDKAERLVGGKIYFHEKQKGPSFFGGRRNQVYLVRQAPPAQSQPVRALSPLDRLHQVNRRSGCCRRPLRKFGSPFGFVRPLGRAPTAGAGSHRG